MGDNSINRKIKIDPNSYSTRLLGIKPGVYDVYVGDWGWDDGDLYIRTADGKKHKLKDLEYGKA